MIFIELKIRGIGIIHDIEPSKFIADGAFYLNEDYYEKEQQSESITLLGKTIKEFFFEQKVNEIIKEVTDNNTDKTVSYRNDEIESFFKEKQGRLLDIIFFADTGIRGTNKINMEENSIIYFKITENIKFGFFINKVMANFLFKEVQDEY